MKLENLYSNIGTEYQTTLERFCSDENMLRMFVMSFPDDSTYQNLEAAVDALNYTEIESHAHALKGVSANLGFNKLQNACSEVVLCVRQQKLENIPPSFQRVKEAYQNIIDEIQKLK